MTLGIPVVFLPEVKHYTVKKVIDFPDPRDVTNLFLHCIFYNWIENAFCPYIQLPTFSIDLLFSHTNVRKELNLYFFMQAPSYIYFSSKDIHVTNMICGRWMCYMWYISEEQKQKWRTSSLLSLELAPPQSTRPHLHIGATAIALLDINLIWFGYIARLSKWGGGVYFTR